MALHAHLVCIDLSFLVVDGDLWPSITLVKEILYGL